jgi:hypothetical protein
MFDRLLALWVSEPNRVIAVLAAVVVFAAAKFGIVVAKQSVVDALVLVLPILLGHEIARKQVTPVADQAPETNPSGE